MVRITAVMPVGPGTREDFLRDSVESIRFWTKDARIILVDDSGEGLTRETAEQCSAEVVTTPGNGPDGGLYLTLSAGYKAALEKPFDLLLRLDTDAIVANRGFEEPGLQFFKEHPKIGCTGSYRYGYNGGVRSRRPQKVTIARNLTVGVLSHPGTSTALAYYLSRAKINRPSYRLGESVLGGACLYSRSAVEALEARGLLSLQRLHRCSLGEDHIFGMLLAVAGFGLADMARKDDPPLFGLRHVGIPASPETLMGEGRCLVHSVRSWGAMGEAEVRARFARARQSGVAHSG